jgi:hypothetical protein
VGMSGRFGRAFITVQERTGGASCGSGYGVLIARPFCPVVSCAAMLNQEDISTPPPEVNAAEPPKAPNLSDVLKWLGTHRDGFLVGGAILYGFGYMVRWLFTTEYSQGDLPALDFQYMMSGAIPVLVLALTWAAIVLFAQWRMRVAQLFSGVKVWVRLLIVGVPLGGTCFLIDHFGIEGLGFSGFLLVQIIFLVLFYCSMLITDESDTTVRNGIVFMFLVFSFVLYFWMYPSIPRALGGPKPRQAYVDFVRDEVAVRTLEDLIPVEHLAPTLASSVGSPRIVRSKLLDVYFSNSDSLWVRPHIDGSINLGPIYELRKETIRAIQWCGKGS